MATPAQMRDRYRRIAHRHRSIPGAHGLREHSLSVRLATSDGTHAGDGGITGDWTDITESGGTSPRVRWANDEQIALGQLERGTAIVGPITPSFSGGGTLLATLTGADAIAKQALQFRITGPRHPDGAIYALLDSNEERALHYKIRLRPVTDQL